MKRRGEDTKSFSVEVATNKKDKIILTLNENSYGLDIGITIKLLEELMRAAEYVKLQLWKDVIATKVQ